jgi:acetyl-CoA synthetase
VKNNVALDEEDLVTELKLQVRDHIGAFARPDHILITPALPKTRSGKIMRRLLRKIASQEFDSLGDITTLADTGVVEDLIERVKKLYKL